MRLNSIEKNNMKRNTSYKMQNNNTSAFISSKKDIVKFDPSKKHKK